ncbi:nicotinate-nucleotide--dimethylbenzimidazole phosphoribosyltransferase [Streptomyces sp. NPDC058001]|uniref:nicotinate-nucleotide--dimethylbenzimidazole phosphoribosyltransferase n=1 Tax=Streptomyces sp. NPDC058001 TaxID=3346300 RepID=UPI0036E7153B
MTDTGQIPGEGLPESAGGGVAAGSVQDLGAGQSGVQAPSAYTYLDPAEPPAEDDDLLLMPGAQGAWSDGPSTSGAGLPGVPDGAVAYPPVTHTTVVPSIPTSLEPESFEPDPFEADPYAAPQVTGTESVVVPDPAAAEVAFEPAVMPEPAAVEPPVTTAETPVTGDTSAETPAPQEPAAQEPVAQETAGRDTGSVDLGDVRASGAPSGPARRPLHLGPPLPDAAASPVRSLSDRGPAGSRRGAVKVRRQSPPTIGPEYLDVPSDATPLPGPQLGEIPVQGGAPWSPLPPNGMPGALGDAPAESVAPDLDPAPASAPASATPPATAFPPAPAPEPAYATQTMDVGQLGDFSSPANGAPSGDGTQRLQGPQQVLVPGADAHLGAPSDAPSGETSGASSGVDFTRPAEAPDSGAFGQFVPVDGTIPTTPHLAPTPPHALRVPPVPENGTGGLPIALPPAAVPVPEAQVPVTEAGAEAGLSEEALAEQPVAESSAAEEAAIAEAAVAEAVVAEVPLAEAVVTEATVTEGPVTEESVTDVAVAEQPLPEPVPLAPASAAAPDAPAEATPDPHEAAPDLPQAAPDAPEATEAPERSDVPEGTDAPDVPEASEAPRTSEAPDAPAPLAASAPQPPADLGTPEAPDGPDHPDAPDALETPGAPAPSDLADPADVSLPAPRTGEAPLPATDQDNAPEPLAAQSPDGMDTRFADEGGAPGDVSGADPDRGAPAPAYDDAEREAVLRVMRERRDIRNGFRPDPIPHEVLLRVLEAAHTAPSVGHSQPWDFVVIRSADTRRAMHELAMRQRDAYAKSLPKGRAKQFKELKIEAILDTPVNIVVTADPTRGGRHTLGRHTQPQMAPYSSALAVENLWLAARAEGLGVGWVSFFDEREMVRALDLPEHLEVVAYLCVGYVDEFPEEPELAQSGWSKRRPLSWVVHEETYGRRALPGEEPHDLLAETIAGIRPLDAKALGEAWERQKRMTKPAGALGMLEIISAQLSGLSRMCPPPIPEPAAVAIFAGDHGVHAQGVTPWPQEVTGQMVANFLGGGAVCNAFAHQVGAEVCVIDVGVASELPSTPGLLPRKVRAGTGDMTTGPALTRDEVKAAIEVGIETARDLVAAGNKALLTGEMGIANTTASAALIAVYTGADPAEVTGRGTGINDETLARKTEVVRRALELHQPDPADPIGVLAAIGGLEHAAIVGLLLGGASLRTPVVLDGVSAGAAALVARAIAPEALAACIAGHRSAEPGHVAALNKLGLRPLIDLDLRLGEGTGALLALPLVQSAARAMHEVATFDSAGVTEK